MSLQETWEEKEHELHEESMQLARSLEQLKAESAQYEKERGHYMNDEEKIQSAIKEKVFGKTKFS